MEQTTINAGVAKKQFVDLAKKYIQREGINSLLDMLEKSDFYTAPASTRFHGSVEGGLCMHSITVGKRLMELADIYAPGMYSKETLAIVALFHDLCKIDVYKIEMRNVKNEQGVWEKVPFYKFSEDFAFGGHGSKSVFLVMEHMMLTRDEAVAINNHMGFGGVQNITAVSEAYENCMLAWLLHIADEAATYVDKI